MSRGARLSRLGHCRGSAISCAGWEAGALKWRRRLNAPFSPSPPTAARHGKGASVPEASKESRAEILESRGRRETRKGRGRAVGFGGGWIALAGKRVEKVPECREREKKCD